MDDGLVNDHRLLVRDRFNFLPAKEYFHDTLCAEARRNSFNPVVDYLSGLRWDGVERISRWLSAYGAAPDTPYVRAVGRIVLVAAVRRVFEPGCKFDEMLVLESLQGTNKSSALALLAVRDEWFSDDLPLDADGKRAIEALNGKWIVEAAELTGMRRSDIDRLKAMLSRQADRGRLAYARLPVEVPRRSVFIGTTNNDEYLQDTTGNRRFWPVKIGRFDLDALRRDRDQLWAEAVHAHQSGESIRLDPGLWTEAAAEQAERVEKNAWHDYLAELFDGRDGRISLQDVWAALGVEVAKRTDQDSRRINAAMATLGWTKKTVRIDGKPTKGFTKGDGKTELTVMQHPGGARIVTGPMPGLGGSYDAIR
nr:virulence-associated E family protein [Paracoccus bogoriensis]